MIFFNGKKLSEIEVITDGKPSSEKAKRIFEEYAEKTCGKADKRSGKTEIAVTEIFDDDFFDISQSGEGIRIEGGKRGVIYGVYEIFERAGWRFLAKGIEYFPEKDVYLTSEDITTKQTTPVKYREVLGNSSGNSANSFLKFRHNTNFWAERLKEEDGGGIFFAGVPAHSMTGSENLKEYAETHPEYFSLKNGKRITDRMGQVCFSNSEMRDAVVKSSLKLLRAKPQASYISVTPGDNGNYCECENCKKLYEKYSLSDLFVMLANKVARAVKDEFPKVKIHIFAYGALQEPPSVPLEDNVIIQYCYNGCKNHSYSDENCPVNTERRKLFESWTKGAKNVLLWDYANCFKYELISLPSIKNMLSEFRYYVSHNITGMFFEYIHMDGVGSSVFAELKTYLLSKLMWDPYMSEEEFSRHKTEFARLYYGRGYEKILEYIDLYENTLSENAHFSYDLLKFHKSADGEWSCRRSEDGEYGPDFDSLIEENKREAFFKKAFALFDAAAALAADEQKERIAKDRIQVLYLYNILNFDKAMKSGTEEEKEKVLSVNKELIDGIIRYDLRITFWGQTTEDMHKELMNCYSVSPRKWNYKW